MKLSTKIAFAIIAGILAILSLLVFNHFSYTYFTQRLIITDGIDAIASAEKELDSLMLQNDKALYLNQDHFPKQIDKLQSLINALRNNPHVKSGHPYTLRLLEKYDAALHDKIQSLYDFQTTSATIKNSTMAIPALLQKSLLLFHASSSAEALFLSSATEASLAALLAKSTLDSEFVTKIDKQAFTIEHLSFSNPEKQHLAHALVHNFYVFRDDFPLYLKIVNDIKSAPTTEYLEEIRHVFSLENIEEIRKIVYFGFLLILLYIASIALIIYFLLQSERSQRLDALTGLYNRKALDSIIRKTPSPVLLLINITQFKNYNDFYGAAFGDKILIESAKRLLEFCAHGSSTTCFRVGGDEFAVLCSASPYTNPENQALSLIELFSQKPIHINEIEITLSVSIGISSHFPLLETADMAQKELKKSRSKSIFTYSPELELYKRFENNITKAHELRYAIKHDTIIPYFQPILSIESGNIEKYEALARIRMPSGEIKSIMEYYDAIKESRYYPILTRTMLKKSCEIMEGRSEMFSINLSIDDIHNSDTKGYIFSIFQEYPSLPKRMIFEILESEMIEDYKNLSEFIRTVKSYGCKIAIDDFGSGYSNFAHLLNLDIDIIKLDGSLIRELTTNPNAIMIVETIVAFAKKAEIETVAELVYNEETYTSVKKLGIDYAQGYTIGKPAPLA